MAALAHLDSIEHGVPNQQRKLQPGTGCVDGEQRISHGKDIVADPSKSKAVLVSFPMRVFQDSRGHSTRGLMA